jgi:hypothetical protein
VGAQELRQAFEVNQEKHMTTMRAKMYITHIQESFYGPENSKSAEMVMMAAVAAKSYPPDGSDEDNTYAKMSPSAHLSINIANPALFGQFKAGNKFYVDFTPAE